MDAEDLKQKYLKTKGIRCPFCGSFRINAGHPECLDYHIEQLVNCDDCERKWTDVYVLTDVTFLCQKCNDDSLIEGKCGNEGCDYSIESEKIKGE